MAEAPANRVAIIIPARYQSLRYPGKPLAPLVGVTGEARTLIRRTWDCATGIVDPRAVWVATDNDRIADEVARFGGQAVMTAPGCRNGTERCADAIATLGDIADIVVNLQGDAPLTPGFIVDGLAAGLRDDPAASMATPAVRCSPTAYRHLVNDNAEGRVGGTTVVFDRHHRALYFSKRVIPYVALDAELPHAAVHLHLGVYAYRPRALAAYAALPPCQLEELEGLEQIRFLDAGHTVRVVPFEPVGWDCIELNNPQDVPAIEAVLRQRGMA